MILLLSPMTLPGTVFTQAIYTQYRWCGVPLHCSFKCFNNLQLKAGCRQIGELHHPLLNRYNIARNPLWIVTRVSVHAHAKQNTLAAGIRTEQYLYSISLCNLRGGDRTKQSRNSTIMFSATWIALSFPVPSSKLPFFVSTETPWTELEV